MVLKRVSLLALLFITLIVLSPLVALAQDGTTVNAGSLFDFAKPYIFELAAALAAFFVAWASAKLSKLTGLQIEARHREALQSALTNGASYGLNKVGGYLSTKNIDLKNEALSAAVTYVSSSVPDAIAHFNLTPEHVREMVQAKLPTPFQTAVVGELLPFDGKPAAAND